MNRIEKLKKQFDWHSLLEPCKCWACVFIRHIEELEAEIEELKEKKK